MFDSLDILRMAQSFASHAGIRQQAIAQNMANADTPGFKARDTVSFNEFFAESGNGRGAVDPRDALRIDPNPATRTPDGNTVSLEHEMTRAASARQQHETALGIYSMSRDMLRASIGR